MKTAIQTTLFIVCLSFITSIAFSQQSNCKIGILPSVMFQPGSSKLTKTSIEILKKVAGELKNNPQCNLEVKGYGGANKKSQQLSWDHVNTVIIYLNEAQNITKERFIFLYGETDGSEAMVDFAATTESGPSMVPPPHPQLRKIN